MPKPVRFVAPPDDVTEELTAFDPGPQAAAAELDAGNERATPPAPRATTGAGDATNPNLGPNGPAVLELLQRASRLSPPERRRLAEVAWWRWWPLTLPVGGSSAGARAAAILAARGAGRRAAPPWLESKAVPAALGRSADKLVVRAVANAALALVVRDAVTDDVFDALYGPWREVTHR